MTDFLMILVYILPLATNALQYHLFTKYFAQHHRLYYTPLVFNLSTIVMIILTFYFVSYVKFVDGLGAGLFFLPWILLVLALVGLYYLLYFFELVGRFAKNRKNGHLSSYDTIQLQIMIAVMVQLVIALNNFDVIGLLASLIYVSLLPTSYACLQSRRGNALSSTSFLAFSLLTWTISFGLPVLLEQLVPYF